MAYRSISVWLEDILIFIERIKKYVAALSSFEEFQVDEKLIDAVERNFEKISEALKNALQAGLISLYLKAEKLLISGILSIISIMR